MWGGAFPYALHKKHNYAWHLLNGRIGDRRWTCFDRAGKPPFEALPTPKTSADYRSRSARINAELCHTATGQSRANVIALSGFQSGLLTAGEIKRTRCKYANSSFNELPKEEEQPAGYRLVSFGKESVPGIRRPLDLPAANGMNIPP